MQIIQTDYILSPDQIHTDLAVAFGKKIEKIAPLEELQKEYPDAKVQKFPKNSLLMPGLINAHVHLEFSANQTELSYGDFINWLYSVIENRDALISGCQEECMQKALDSMLESGITSFGAISSHGMDLEICANAQQNVVYFNELIGSQAVMADALFGDFLSRLESSKQVNREGFFPAVAIHSPYSVHPILIKKALEIVKDEKLPLTAHFMESQAEREWIDKSQGDFQDFFTKLLKQNQAITSAQEFLDAFDEIPTLFTHAIQSNDKELLTLVKNKHTVIHCPISNRLLGNGALDLSKLDEQNIRWVCATDGLSSNYKLDLFEEMKIALFMHTDTALVPLAKKLLQSVTKDAADALGLNTGQIKEGYNADMLVLDLNTAPTEELVLHLILHRYNISHIFINGKKLKG